MAKSMCLLRRETPEDKRYFPRLYSGGRVRVFPADNDQINPVDVDVIVVVDGNFDGDENARPHVPGT